MADRFNNGKYAIEAGAKNGNLPGRMRRQKNIKRT